MSIYILNGLFSCTTVLKYILTVSAFLSHFFAPEGLRNTANSLIPLLNAGHTFHGSTYTALIATGAVAFARRTP